MEAFIVRQQVVGSRPRGVLAVILVVALAGLAAAPSAIASPGQITTVAGTGAFGYSGDGGQATSAALDSPLGVAADGDGNLYIADNFNHRVRKVSASGTITTVAGTGVGGFSGDGGQATLAKLSNPRGVAVDADGNLYIADTLNNRVRKVTPGGTISTVAGKGKASFSGDRGPATAAGVNPRGVAVDSAGTLYIADTANHRVRKVNGSGTITTVAGTGKAGFSGDGRRATRAKLKSPIGLAVDAAGNLYIADTANSRVRKVNSSRKIFTVAGRGIPGFSGDGGRARAARINHPTGVAIDGQGRLYIDDEWNNRIRKVNGSGIITRLAGTGDRRISGDGGPAAIAAINPRGIALDAAGNLYIVDNRNSRIRKVEADSVPPETTIVSGPSGTTPDATPKFGFTSSQVGSVFQCKLDGGGYSPCRTRKPTKPLQSGFHTFYVRAIDPAGNVDSTPASRRFRVHG